MSEVKKILNIIEQNNISQDRIKKIVLSENTWTGKTLLRVAGKKLILWKNYFVWNINFNILWIDAKKLQISNTEYKVAFYRYKNNFKYQILFFLLIMKKSIYSMKLYSKKIRKVWF